MNFSYLLAHSMEGFGVPLHPGSAGYYRDEVILWLFETSNSH
jgi:hypothetical protein